MFGEARLVITPAVRKRMRADAARLLPEGTLPTAAQWKVIFSDAHATCVVAGAGSGKSSSLVLRIVLLTCYLGVPLAEISVVTFTRASREDFIRRLTYFLSLWGQTLVPTEARRCVTTFHAMALGWARTLPGWVEVQAFESLGGHKTDDNPLQLKIGDVQRQHLTACFNKLCMADSVFEGLVHTLVAEARALPKLAPEHPDVQRRLAGLIPAAKRDLKLTQLIEQQWRKAGRWPHPGIEPVQSSHSLLGQTFHCHGYMPALEAWVMLGPDTSTARSKGDDAGLSIGSQWLVKRTLFQAFFDKPLIWIEKASELEALFDPSDANVTYCLSGERHAQPLLDLLLSTATFMENIGLDAKEAASALFAGQDGLFFQILSRFWPALEVYLEEQSPPVVTYNRLFATFTSTKSHALAALASSQISALQHLMVDEFQDVSPNIATWLQAALRDRCRRGPELPASLMCVGDDWQSIYGWRGSDVQYFLRFKDVFPAPASRRLILRDNFRSTTQIVEAAEHIVRNVRSVAGKGSITHATGTKVKIITKDMSNVVQLADSHIKSNQTVLVLFRSARDDPGGNPGMRALLKAHGHSSSTDARLRCMTIHASKGLEADVVILLGDSIARKGLEHRNRLYTLAGIGRATDSTPYDSTQADEALRLAYVGITRAAQAVYWCVDPSSEMPGQVSAVAQAVSGECGFEDRRVQS